ncbi:calcyphosin-2 isoform X2 [Trichomycterus rosablanca]|uniref:calcyphosin-2 isoform X2 n=1 Tax=Trichomycterus rosablanca TaxID=2290929 RepID=UPI002F3544C1
MKPSQISPSSPVQSNHTQTDTMHTRNRKLEAEGLNVERKTQTVIDQMMVDQLSRAVISDPEQNSANALTASARHKRTLHHTMVKTQKSLTENLLFHKLCFHARILSRCGREACRELIGFYFMCDQTLTVYEYRSFGKNRCSALPFIERGVCRTRGRPYCLADFSQGASLRFSTEGSCVPESLRHQPYLTLRVTHVDEEAKRMLLDQFGESVHWLSEEEISDKRILLAIQGAVHESLKGHAVQTMTGLGRRLKKLDAKQSGLMSKEKLRECLMEELSLSLQDFETVWRIVGLQGQMQVDYNEMIRAVTGEMSETRKAAFIKVYVKLDPNKTGSISLTDIEKFYCGKQLQMDLGVDFLTCLRNTGNVNKFVSFAEFEDYYEGLSIEIPNDLVYINILRSTWNI